MCEKCDSMPCVCDYLTSQEKLEIMTDNIASIIHKFYLKVKELQ